MCVCWFKAFTLHFGARTHTERERARKSISNTQFSEYNTVKEINKIKRREKGILILTTEKIDTDNIN